MSEINLDDFPDLSEDYIEQQAEDLLKRYTSSTGTETSPPHLLFHTGQSRPRILIPSTAGHPTYTNLWSAR